MGDRGCPYCGTITGEHGFSFASDGRYKGNKCTGYTINGMLLHDGDTCPVHEDIED